MKWKRGDYADRIGNHLFAEAILERQVGDIKQIIERVKIRGAETNAYEYPSYRLVEIVGAGKPRIVALSGLLREARSIAQRRVL